ncbi:MAG: hypothetical protein JWP17_3324 [Solirubrobacterales bacterium]|jgi:hypothetical protein|nr:hypothetical protein [Solirubrobacterales bacterium]
MSQTPLPEGESVFDLACYLISSARLAMDETPRYGSLRLIVAASRLIAAAEAMEGVPPDDTLLEWKRSIDENLFKVMNQYPEYGEWLADLTRTVGREATQRNLA